MKLKIGIPILLMAVLFIAACATENAINSNETPVLPLQPFDYVSINDEAAEASFTFAEGMQEFITTNGFAPDIGFGGITREIISNDIATLGRVLFYDQRLSKNNRTSCATCHNQALAFADGLKASEGFAGETTPRNSMAIANPIFNNSFFWDSRERSLEDLSLRPIQNHIEMGMEDLDKLVNKINNVSFYGPLFEKAFGNSLANKDFISVALSDFVSSIYKADSKFDQGLENNFSNLNAQEKLGMALFFGDKAQCSSCHNGINFAAPDGFGGEYRFTGGTVNIGLENPYRDNGFRRGQFKIPSLRNIVMTAPYMHDGRFEDLRAVLDHYNSGVVGHPNLDDKLMGEGGQPQRLGLVDAELDALEAFLKTLTSQSIATDVKLSDPFK